MWVDIDHPEAGVQTYLIFLDSGFPAGLPGNDESGLSATFCEFIKINVKKLVFFF